mgnify:CR=1 FL=1
MKKRNFLSCLLIIAIVLATISPTVLFAAEDIAQDEQRRTQKRRRNM